MLRISLTIVAFAIGFSDAVPAQRLTAEQLAACKPDFDKYCGGRIPNDGRVIGCFVTGPRSDACQKAMDDFSKKRQEDAVGKKN